MEEVLKGGFIMEMFWGFMFVILVPLFFCSIGTTLFALAMFFNSTFVVQSASFWFFKTFLMTLLICFALISLAMSPNPCSLDIFLIFLIPLFRFMRIVN